MFHNKDNCKSMQAGHAKVVAKGGNLAEKAWFTIGVAISKGRDPCIRCYRNRWRLATNTSTSLSSDGALAKSSPRSSDEFKVYSDIAYRLPESTILHCDPSCLVLRRGRSLDGPIRLIRMRRTTRPRQGLGAQSKTKLCQFCDPRHLHSSAIPEPSEVEERDGYSVEDDAECDGKPALRPLRGSRRMLLNDSGKILMQNDRVQTRTYPLPICVEIIAINDDMVTVKFDEGGTLAVPPREILGRCEE